MSRVDLVAPSKIRIFMTAGARVEKELKGEKLLKFGIGEPQVPASKTVYFVGGVKFWLRELLPNKMGQIGYSEANGLERLRKLVAMRHFFEFKDLVKKEESLVKEAFRRADLDAENCFNLLASDESAYNICKSFRHKETRFLNVINTIIGNSNYFCPDRVVITNGVSQALSVVFTKFHERKILIPEPYFLCYDRTSIVASVHPDNLKFIPCPDEKDFQIDPNELGRIAGEGDVLILNSPCNPTGTVYEESTLKEIAGIARKKKLIVMSDEIYDVYAYTKERPFKSFYEILPEQTIMMNGISKSAAMPDARIGYMLISKDFDKFIGAPSIKRASIAKFFQTANQPMTDQYRAIVFYEGYLFRNYRERMIQKNVERYNAARKAIIDIFTKYKGEGIVINGAEGAFYAFPNITEFFNRNKKGFGSLFHEELMNPTKEKLVSNLFSVDCNSAEIDYDECKFYYKGGERMGIDDIFSFLMLLKYHTIVIPGSEFGKNIGAGHVRISYPPDVKEVKDFGNRLDRLVNDLKAYR